MRIGLHVTFSEALYGLESSGKRWAETLHEKLKDMDFTPSRADQCIWLKKNTKLNLYEYTAVYVDDLCIAAQDPKEMINILRSKYKLKVKGDGPSTMAGQLQWLITLGRFDIQAQVITMSRFWAKSRQ